MEKIKLIAMDVDGTMTDGSINIGPDGELFKSFDVKDGWGITDAEDHHGVVFAVITGRSSEIVDRRCAELRIAEVHQGVSDKKAVLMDTLKKYGIKPEESAYIGDDLIDLECMNAVGYPMAPADAVPEVKKSVKYVSAFPGGHGAVRDCIEHLKSMGKL
jgi:3-deoxy-D-manno-octulosonate 8-phosphate phosphatase (KDO 8-P phosphatase)